MKKLSFLTGFIMLGLAGTSFASDPVITLDDTDVEVSFNEGTIGFSTDQSYANLQIEFIQDPPNGVAVLRGGGSNGQQIFIPIGSREGQWIINQVSYDTDEGPVVYRRDTSAGGVPLTEAMADLSIYVYNIAPDTVAPEVTEFVIPDNQFTKSDDGLTIYAPFTITVTDDDSGSGFRSLEGGFTGSGDTNASVSMLISEDDRIGDSHVYQGYIEFTDALPGEIFMLDEIFIQDNAGNAIYYAEWYGDKTVNNYTVDRTEPFPEMFAITIQLPENFNDIPLRSSSGSGASSSSGPVVQSVKKIKKGKKGKDSAKNSKSSKKKGSSAKKSKGSKKSSAKKSKSVQK